MRWQQLLLKPCLHVVTKVTGFRNDDDVWHTLWLSRVWDENKTCSSKTDTIFPLNFDADFSRISPAHDFISQMLSDHDLVSSTSRRQSSSPSSISTYRKCVVKHTGTCFVNSSQMESHNSKEMRQHLGEDVSTRETQDTPRVLFKTRKLGDTMCVNNKLLECVLKSVLWMFYEKNTCTPESTLSRDLFRWRHDWVNQIHFDY